MERATLRDERAGGCDDRIAEAQEAERLQLAEDLHDGPAQALANVLFRIEVIDRSADVDPAAVQAEVRALRAMLERELDSVRGHISRLRPSLQGDGDLANALLEAAADVSAAGLRVEARLEAPARSLGVSQRAVVVRIAQEALRNARAHAGATHAVLATRRSRGAEGAGRWILEVRDDGHGFDLATVTLGGSRRHFGLRFMRERAALIGADLEIEPGPLAGTVVRLTIDDADGTERSR